MTITESADEEDNEQDNDSTLEADAEDEKQWFKEDGTPVSGLEERHWEFVDDFFTKDNAEIVGIDIVLHIPSCADRRWSVKGYNKELFCSSMQIVYREMARELMEIPHNAEVQIKLLT